MDLQQAIEGTEISLEIPGRGITRIRHSSGRRYRIGDPDPGQGVG